MTDEKKRYHLTAEAPGKEPISKIFDTAAEQEDEGKKLKN